MLALALVLVLLFASGPGAGGGGEAPPAGEAGGEASIDFIPGRTTRWRYYASAASAALFGRRKRKEGAALLTKNVTTRSGRRGIDDEMNRRRLWLVGAVSRRFQRVSHTREGPKRGWFIRVAHGDFIALCAAT